MTAESRRPAGQPTAHTPTPRGNGPLRTSRLRVLDIETRVIEGGPRESAEAVLLLHGNPGSAEDWAVVQASLATGRASTIRSAPQRR
jgi:pimeloyl-ACP methyl ester carboxylesterase